MFADHVRRSGAVGRHSRSLRAVSRRVDPGRRLAGDQSAAGAYFSWRRVFTGASVLRYRVERRADRRARGAGHRRRVPRPRQPRDHQRGVRHGRCGRAIGTWSGFTAITTSVGPVAGGWLVEHVGWRSVFYLNLPLAAVVVAMALARVPESRDREHPGPLDWSGAVSAVVGLGGVIYALLESQTRGWRDPGIVAAAALGAAGLVAFLWRESAASHPMMPMTLFRSRTFSMANALTFFLTAPSAWCCSPCRSRSSR